MLQEQLAGGVIDLLLLALLRDDTSYGYELTQTLERHGLKSVSETTVYTSLRRLEKQRMLTSRQRTMGGRARRYYSLSAAGARELDRSIEAWHGLARVVDSVLGGLERTGR